jgi:hypothetical protein
MAGNAVLVPHRSRRVLARCLGALQDRSTAMASAWSVTHVPPQPLPAECQEHYPTASEVDQWCDVLVAEATQAAQRCRVKAVDAEGRPLSGAPSGRQPVFLRFEADGVDSFFCNWRPAAAHAAQDDGPCPLVVTTPGYSGGFDKDLEPTELTAAGYGLLHINPLGYGTPQGNDLSKRTAISPAVQRALQSAGEGSPGR